MTFGDPPKSTLEYRPPTVKERIDQLVIITELRAEIAELREELREVYKYINKQTRDNGRSSNVID